MREVSALVLAAGLSTRFGGLNKLLQPWGESTVVGEVTRVLLSCGLRVLVVTGRDSDLVAQAVAPAETTFNSNFAEGMGTSIACGVAALRESDGILICLGDMPGLDSSVVRSLLEAFERAPSDRIVAPAYSLEPDRPGHPVLFGAAYRQALMRLTGDSGARSVLRSASEELRLVPVDGSLADLDSPV